MSRPALSELLRFAVVGVAVALLYLCLFVLLVRLGAPRVAANATAFAVAVAVQYLGQSAWTFRRRWSDGGQARRFLATIALGFVTSTALSAFVGPALGWPDWLSAAAVTVVLPVQNYVLFRIWVFARIAAPVEAR